MCYNAFMENETLEAVLKASGSQLALFLTTLVFGIISIKLFIKLLKRILLISSMDNAVVRFFTHGIEIILSVLLVLYDLSLLNIPLTSMIAVISAFGVAIGLAIQDSIANVANGLIMIGTRPFKVGDYVQIGSDEGRIEELGLMNTILSTVDNKKLILPNRHVSTSRILNYNTNPIRRIDLYFSVDYETDVDKALEATKSACLSCRKVLRSPAPRIELYDMASSSLTISAWCWIDSHDYYDAFFEIKKAVWNAYKESRITIPFDQLVISERPGGTSRKRTQVVRQKSGDVVKSGETGR